MQALKLSQIIDGYLFDQSLTFSPNTIRNYTKHFNRLSAFLGNDPIFSDITIDDLKRFIHHLQTIEVHPAGVAPRPAKTLSAKTVKNVHTGLSSLWRWACEQGYVATNIVRQIKPPEPPDPPITTFSRDEIRSLLEATKYARPRSDKRHIRNRRPQYLADRDQAIVLFLLDTGVRATELCKLKMRDVDLKKGEAEVQNKGRLDRGEGKKRTIEFGKRTRRALWKYLTHRGEPGPLEHLFTTQAGDPLGRRSLARLMQRLGKRAGISDAHPHKFRHTFATQFLETDSNIYRLQRLMGHESLDMLRRYVHHVRAQGGESQRTSVADEWL